MVIALSIHMYNSDNIIHESRWAVTEKCGDKVYKIFLHDSYMKIQKEVSLLKLSLGQKVNLSFDTSTDQWVCESDYLELRPIVGNIHLNKFIEQLQQILCMWKIDSRYSDLISDEWSNITIPWYSMLLRQYIPDSENIVNWLRHSQGEHFIHGDFTLSNIHLNQCNKIVVLDYENASLGPLLWDETTLVYSFIEEKQFGVAKQIYDTFGCRKEMLRAICSIRLALSMRKGHNIERRIEAYEFVMHNY